jgi:hypothetical protein
VLPFTRNIPSGSILDRNRGDYTLTGHLFSMEKEDKCGGGDGIGVF